MSAYSIPNYARLFCCTLHMIQTVQATNTGICSVNSFSWEFIYIYVYIYSICKTKVTFASPLIPYHTSRLGPKCVHVLCENTAFFAPTSRVCTRAVSLKPYLILLFFSQSSRLATSDLLSHTHSRNSKLRSSKIGHWLCRIGYIQHDSTLFSSAHYNSAPEWSR